MTAEVPPLPGGGGHGPLKVLDKQTESFPFYFRRMAL